MIKETAKLSKKALTDKVEMSAIRNGYGEALLALGESMPEVVVLCADLKESTRVEAFANKFPERYFEMGVAEQNMATVAAGLGVSGKIPFISSYATFSPGRNWEQIRTTISYNDSNVKIAGHHAGISVGPDGATHQAVEDIATMRVMANMKVIVPCDAEEARKATIASAKIWGPVYLRFAREATPVITTAKSPFIPGKAEIFWESKKPEATIIACGTLVATALEAAAELEREGMGSIVLNNHTIKPLDEQKILELAKKTGAIVTAEEHQVAGGMGSAVAEFLARTHPTPQEFIGLQNTYGESGKPDELMRVYGMGVKDIIAAAHRAIKRK